MRDVNGAYMECRLAWKEIKMNMKKIRFGKDYLRFFGWFQLNFDAKRQGNRVILAMIYRNKKGNLVYKHEFTKMLEGY